MSVLLESLRFGAECSEAGAGASLEWRRAVSVMRIFMVQQSVSGSTSEGVLNRARKGEKGTRGAVCCVKVTVPGLPYAAAGLGAL